MTGIGMFTGVKNKFRSFLMQRKQLKALKNYSEVGKCEHTGYIVLLQKCMNESFLDQKEADFLCHMVDKYAINVMDWCYKTPWLKKQMKAMAKGTETLTEHSQVEKSENQLMMFEDKEGMRTAVMIEPMRQSQVDVPVQLVTYQSPWESRVRA